jgi:hypothetical protein
MAEGTRFPLPAAEDQVTLAGVRHFGNWLRIAADLPDGSELVAGDRPPEGLRRDAALRLS